MGNKELWLNGNPVVSIQINNNGDKVYTNSLNEKFYECVYCGVAIAEGYSTEPNRYVCCDCAE
jgi:hypothetical protein